MKQNSNRYFTLWIGLIIFLFTSHICAQDNEIIKINSAIEKSKWVEFSDYCQETISLSVLNSQGNFSKVQARYILADFFKNNTIIKLNIINSGKISEEYFFSILQSESANKTFNIYYTIQKKENSYLINNIQVKEKSK